MLVVGSSRDRTRAQPAPVVGGATTGAREGGDASSAIPPRASPATSMPPLGILESAYLCRRPPRTPDRNRQLLRQAAATVSREISCELVGRAGFRRQSHDQSISGRPICRSQPATRCRVRRPLTVPGQSGFLRLTEAEAPALRRDVNTSQEVRWRTLHPAQQAHYRAPWAPDGAQHGSEHKHNKRPAFAGPCPDPRGPARIIPARRRSTGPASGLSLSAFI